MKFEVKQRVEFGVININYSCILKCFVAIFFLLLSQFISAQKVFKGMILNDETSLPIAFASVGVLGQEIGSISDSSGAFKVRIPNSVKDNDTILFSSIGFSPLKLPVREAMAKKKFELHPLDGILPSIMVYDFKKTGKLGDDTTNYAFYRGWYEYRTGGEIGRIIKVLHKQYKLNKVAFQVDNKCDTCWLRLRVRKVSQFEPGDDLLKQSVIIPITKHIPNEGVLEFDISDLGLLLTEKKVYIGFEVIDCKNNDGQPLSLCFIGANYGDHYFRKYPTVKWVNEDGYGLYLKMFFDY
jgi:hypothetical protein